MAVAPDLARALCEISIEIQRQVGLLIDRRGHVRLVIVGDSKSVFIPDLSSFRRGRDRLIGLRLVHTHLNSEPISEDDLTDLALLRLDAVIAIEVLDEGLPGKVQVAHMLPDSESKAPWEIHPPVSVHTLPDDFLAMIEALEEELARLRGPRRAGDNRDRAILVHVSTDPPSIAEDSLDELEALCRSAGFIVVDRLVQRRSADPRYVMGQGRLKQAIVRAMQLGAEALIFDMNLSAAQVRALADLTDLKVLDRTQVILDIFAQRAQTREGKIQVELAQLRYMLPRLGAKQAASAFSRLTGGIGGRGPGETKLEIDRRRAKDRIAQLEREVDKLGQRRRLRRGMRTRRELPIVSVVGYTNAGKSTLLNHLTNSSVVAQDTLFATLNPVSRRLRMPEEREIIITDTVGFIRQLPADLMAAFRTTLEELQDADLLLHVLDISSKDIDEHYDTVRQMLGRLELDDKPILLALNKIDRCDPVEVETMVARYGGVPVSAVSPDTFGPLLEAMDKMLWTPVGN